MVARFNQESRSRGKAGPGSSKVKRGSQSAGLGQSPAQQAVWPGQSGSPGTASSLSLTFPGGKGLPWAAALLSWTWSSAAKPLGREVLSYASTVSLIHLIIYPLTLRRAMNLMKEEW